MILPTIYHWFIMISLDLPMKKWADFLQPSISCSLADAQLATARSLGSAVGCDAADSSAPATLADTGDAGDALGTAWANLGTKVAG